MIRQNKGVLYCIVLYCIVLCCIVLYCIVLYCNERRVRLSGQPDVSGMGSVDGDGVLTVGESGKAEWLIIPYSEAAPTHDVQYDIAGTLYYTVGGDNITVPLFPDTITVTPDPRLYLNYFLEKFVKSDDPMTKGMGEGSKSNQIKSVLYFQMKIEIYNICTYTSNVCNSNGKGESISVLLINHFPPISK